MHNELFCGSYLMCICDLMTIMFTDEEEDITGWAFKISLALHCQYLISFLKVFRRQQSTAHSPLFSQDPGAGGEDHENSNLWSLTPCWPQSQPPDPSGVREVSGVRWAQHRQSRPGAEQSNIVNNALVSSTRTWGHARVHVQCSLSVINRIQDRRK